MDEDLLVFTFSILDEVVRVVPVLLEVTHFVVLYPGVFGSWYLGSWYLGNWYLGSWYLRSWYLGSWYLGGGGCYLGGGGGLFG